MSMKNERRKKVRVQVDVQGELWLGDRSYAVMLCNVSLGGCLLETSARPRMREIIALKIRSGFGIEEFKLKVVWQSYGQGLGKIGTQFHGMSEDAIHGALAGILGAFHDRNQKTEGGKNES